MSEWKQCLLGSIAEVQTGPFGSQLKNEQYITGGTPVITVEHINAFRIQNIDYPSVTEADRKRLERYSLSAGDIVFTRVGSVDLSAYVKPENQGWLFSSRMLRVRVSTVEVDPLFLSYFFRQEKFREYILNIAVGATMPSINTQILKDIPISYPCLPEQKAIASVLSSLDDKIDLLHRQNKTLEAMAETLFRQWFIEEAKEDWKDGVLEQLIDLKYGKALKQEHRSGSGYPVVASSGIVGFHKDYLVQAPGIVIGRKGTLGKVYFMEDNFYPIDTSYFIQSKTSGSNLIFEYYLLKSLDFANMNSDSAVPGLNRNIALSTQIQIPPKELILNFNETAQPWFSKIHSNTKQIQTLENLRDTLLPKLMSGEVRVQYQTEQVA